MTLPRKFLNEDEELLVEMRPHWVFFARRLFIAVAVVAGLIALLVGVPSIPNWVAYALIVLAAVPVVWFLGRLLRWRIYTLALTTTRVVVRRGVVRRSIVQLRLQRITEINLSQKLWERMVGTGRLIIDVQGEDDAVVLEFVRKPTLVQRVINGQINELSGGGAAEPIPEALRRRDKRPLWSQPEEEEDDHDTPPFGVPLVPPLAADEISPGAPPAAAPSAPGARPFEIRDRLIELDDLRQRGIISDEEFATKKAELLNRI